jgi:hypothetical protein
MTAWQDQPPVSRRQVRQAERDETVVPQSTSEQLKSEQAGPDQTSPEQADPDQNLAGDTSFAGLARQGWDAEARRTSTPQRVPESSVEATVARGRRVQQPATNERAAGIDPEPLAFITQARPQVPNYDGRTLRESAVSAVSEGSGLPETLEVPDERTTRERSDFRTRDFSPPESGRSAFRPVSPSLNWAPPVVASVPQSSNGQAIQAAPQSSAESSRPEPVLTRRQMRELGVGGFVTTPNENDEAERAAAAEASAQAQPDAALVAEAQVGAEAVSPERPRFRDRASRGIVDPEFEREDVRREEQSDYSVQAPDLAPSYLTEPPALIEPPVRPPFTGAIPTRDATIADIVEATPVPIAVSPPIVFVSTPIFAVDSTVQPEVVVAELETNEEETPAFEDLLFPSGQSVETTVGPERGDAVPTIFDAFLGESEAPAASVAITTPSGSVVDADDPSVRPVGHWSTQALIDDGEQVQENTFARDVGATSGAITTSALVLPSMPTGEDMMGPLSGTGEILITGSINLPSSMGTTGVHPARYDHSDVDALLEADDREDSSDPESAPVRAIRAVSTNTGSGDVINSMKPRRASRLPLILIVSAAVMAIGVVVLLVAGFIFKIF